MGVRTLVGEYDGTTPAAVMVNSLDDVPFGPLFKGGDAYEQVEAFLEWMRGLSFMSRCEEIGLASDELPSPLNEHPEDPRAWPDKGLARLVAWWRAEHVDEHGWLVARPEEAS